MRPQLKELKDPEIAEAVLAYGKAIILFAAERVIGNPKKIYHASEALETKEALLVTKINSRISQ